MNETAGYFHSLDDSFARNGLIASSRATSESRRRTHAANARGDAGATGVPSGYRPFILSVTRKIALRIASETRACYGP